MITNSLYGTEYGSSPEIFALSGNKCIIIRMDYANIFLPLVQADAITTKHLEEAGFL